MPRIVALSTAVPPYCFYQHNLRELGRLHFGNGLDEIDRLIPVFDHVQVRRRFFSVPIEWFGTDHTFEEKNNAYIRWAEELGLQVAETCLASAGLKASQIDHLVFVSTSGLATPSIDARIINRAGFARHIRRTPVFGWGCAGGAAGISRCCDLACAYPAGRILLISIELSSLTFQRNDFSKSNLVASALFSDGAAAALICGDACELPGIEIVDSQSTLWPDTLDVMGWTFTSAGLSVVFSRNIPHILSTHIQENVASLLDRHAMTADEIAHFVIHPGGAKVLGAMEAALGLNHEKVRYSRHILENYGNMSAPTVLFILDYLLQEGAPRAGDYGLLAAFGPGFSSELLLLRW